MDRCNNCGASEVRLDDGLCYRCQVAKETLRQRMLECQHNYQSSGEVSYGRPKCERCGDRFICHTIKVKSFTVKETYVVYKTWRVYAETEYEAQELFYSFSDDVAHLEDEDTGNADTEIEEAD